MAILRLIVDRVGPFEHLDLDFSDGRGNPHLGPHVICGVNGSGKSTVLKSIAAVRGSGLMGFDREGFDHLAWAGHAELIVHMVVTPDDAAPDTATTGSRALLWEHSPSIGGPAAAYASSLALRSLDVPPQVDLAAMNQRALSFAETVRNDVIQRFWVDLFSKHAIAETRGLGSRGDHAGTLDRFRRCLQALTGPEAVPDVDTSGAFIQPRLKLRGKELNFSQLPDGVRSVLGWLTDYFIRQEIQPWEPKDQAKRPGVLLIDEIETHLHPAWQRRIVPALREAFPNVQLFLTTHSPFVINSYLGARVHLLDVDEHGKAFLKESFDGPAGQSIAATIKDIFVKSDYDVDTEEKLKQWNELKRREAVAPLTDDERRRLVELAENLASRGDELRNLVMAPPMPESLLRSLESIGTEG